MYSESRIRRGRTVQFEYSKALRCVEHLLIAVCRLDRGRMCCAHVRARPPGGIDLQHARGLSAGDRPRGGEADPPACCAVLSDLDLERSSCPSSHPYVRAHGCHLGSSSCPCAARTYLGLPLPLSGARGRGRAHGGDCDALVLPPFSSSSPPVYAPAPRASASSPPSWPVS